MPAWQSFWKGNRLLARLGRSMHFFDRKNHMYGRSRDVALMFRGSWNGFRHQYRGEDRVTLCFFGDGAINQGAFHEA